MNSKNCYLIAVILALAACDAREKPRERNLAFQKRAEVRSKPRCSDCDLNNDQLGSMGDMVGLTSALFGAQKKLEVVLKKEFTDLEELRSAIEQVLKDTRDTVGPQLDRHSENFANFNSCAALKDVFSDFKHHLFAILDTLDLEWHPLIEELGSESVLTQLAIALQIAQPHLFRLIRDLSHDLLPIMGDCIPFENSVWTQLDPNPNNFAYKTAENALSFMGTTTGPNGAGNFLVNLLKSFEEITRKLMDTFPLSPAERMQLPVSISTTIYQSLCSIMRPISLDSLFIFCPPTY